jgi:hypothetical protein
MSAMASVQGYSLTNKVWQVCNGWVMEAKRANGSPAIRRQRRLPSGMRRAECGGGRP